MALLKKDNYVLYAGGNADLQTVIYGTTKWADIDFEKNLMLRYTVGDTTVCSAVYTATDLALKFYVNIENDVYVVQLLNDDTWSATIVDSSSVYEAQWGLSLRLLNAVPKGTFVYTKDGSDIYLNSYRSDTEWRFTQIDGDLIHEAVVTANGWTVNTHSIGGGSISNVVISYGKTPSQTFAELTDLAANGLLYARMMSTVLQASSWDAKTIEFSNAYGHYVSSWKYDANSGWSSSVEDTAKASVDSGSTPGYLEDVIVTDNDTLEIIKNNGKLYLHVDTDITSDPKIQTLDEFVVNSATSNYGAYALNDGYSRLEWNNPQSYSYINALCFQCMRISDAQGLISKCNIAMAGNLSGTAPCFNVGLFSLKGTLPTICSV